MNTFAQVNSKNTVINIVMADNSSNLQNIEANTWVEVSSNTIAHIGGTYDSSNNIFIPIKQYDSWVFDYSLKRWVAPVDYPDEPKPYHWDEENKVWVLDTTNALMNTLMEEIRLATESNDFSSINWGVLTEANIN
jgi:hypothetical protein